MSHSSLTTPRSPVVPQAKVNQTGRLRGLSCSNWRHVTWKEATPNSRAGGGETQPRLQGRFEALGKDRLAPARKCCPHRWEDDRCFEANYCWACQGWGWMASLPGSPEDFPGLESPLPPEPRAGLVHSEPPKSCLSFISVPNWETKPPEKVKILNIVYRMSCWAET
jgi:hypothetical protein